VDNKGRKTNGKENRCFYLVTGNDLNDYV